MIKLIMMALALYGGEAQSSGLVKDYSLQSFARTYTPGFFVAGNLGLSKRIWEDPRQRFTYGFLRASGTFQTSAVVNSVMGQVDFYPISFLGFFSGVDFTNRQFNMFTFDCEQVQCKGNLRRTYLGSRLGMQVGPYFLMSDVRLFDLKVDSNRPFAEERAALEGNPGHDRMIKTEILMGRKLTETFSAGLLYQRHEMFGHKNMSTKRMVFGRLQHEGNKNYLLGVGTFEVRTGAEVFCLLFGMQYWGDRGLLLF